jgi:hypothetical protein
MRPRTAAGHERFYEMGVSTTVASFCGIAMSMIIYIIIATWQLARTETRLIDTGRSLVDSLRREIEADMAARDAAYSKARHDTITQIDRTLMELRANLRDTDARHALLDREAIRKSDLAAFESRIMAALGALEARFTSALATNEMRRSNEIEKLDSRLTIVAERKS